MNDQPDRALWERHPGETARAYEAFRRYRDQGPLRTIRGTQLDGTPAKTMSKWATQWQWTDRARAWDEQVYREADVVRMEALRQMYRSHQLAGRVALAKAMEALQQLPAGDINAASAARLLDLGTRLERVTLASTLADLQGVERGESAEDPWEVIARELVGATAEIRDTAEA